MSDKAWLYLYENAESKALYVGICESMGRVFQGCNPVAEELREQPGTLIRQTSRRFSTRRDALIAEAVAIHVAVFAGRDVMVEREDWEEIAEQGEGASREGVSGSRGTVHLTNIQSTQSTKYLSPAIFVKSGEVRQDELTNTLIVPISPDEVRGMPSPFGGHSGEEFAARATKWWNVAVEKRRHVRHLLAVLRGCHVVLGSWEIDPMGEWRLNPEYETRKSAYRTRIEIPLVSPAEHDYGGLRGKTYMGTLNQGVAYSPDVPK
ncbi:hypothetical protein H8R18_07605 [Nanchangia anserum]|uniref:GIY-YIG nuclease family protein n=1 Tax=Nanchangia anserum TaxID=2692125 RepID=A0A8I0KPY4_9ACTO|nr:hypothetical protein [Nanchangia anserum]MBD3689390.1 hypothetical protein [Nanchangia anserum]QOX81595.1 hypothetical protein H8R18_07605 [Nanchangia anserum]